jgi:outer membrane protein assembly factor BamB
LLLLAVPASAEDWPQFRGPTGQGHSTERGLPLDWSESKNVIWKTPVPGSGWSSPVVGGGQIWLTSMTAPADPRRGRGALSLRTLAFDVATGRETLNIEVFRVDSPEPMHQKNSRASPTPILAGDRVYVHFGAEGTAALTTKGEIVWKIRLPYESQHGNGGSPILYRDLLIVNCDGNGGDAYVAAIDTATGKIRWRTDRRRPADQAYSTPLIIRVGDRDQLVSPGAYRAAAYDPLTGKEIWRVRYDDGFSNVPRPVFGQGLVYIATGFNTPTLMAVRPDGTGDVTRTHVAWTTSRGAPYTPSPVVVGDEFYYISDTGILTCVNAQTGAMLWQQRLGGNYSASPVFADGRLYFVSEEGVTTVVAPGKTFQKLASSRLDGATLASMAISNGSIFMRTESHLYRIAERQ